MPKARSTTTSNPRGRGRGRGRRRNRRFTGRRRRATAIAHAILVHRSSRWESGGIIHAGGVEENFVIKLLRRAVIARHPYPVRVLNGCIAPALGGRLTGGIHQIGISGHDLGEIILHL